MAYGYEGTPPRAEKEEGEEKGEFGKGIEEEEEPEGAEDYLDAEESGEEDPTIR
jgi:hypothetical protein